MTVMKENELEALDLTWDGNSTVSTTLHGKYFTRTSGLCGNWDENSDNDQVTILEFRFKLKS